MNLRDLRLHRFPGGPWLERMGIRLVSGLEYLQMVAHKDQHVLRSILRARLSRRSLVTFSESFLIDSLVRALRDMDGDMAEVGVYEGSTARIICDRKGGKHVHLFDTFEGLPPGDTPVEKQLYPKRAYRCSLESVQAYLSQYRDVTFYQGVFPASAAGIGDDVRYCFVHIDVDLYQSTLACLEYFYPRMHAGGILLSHDYSILTSVQRAFTEFLADKQENLIELPTTQCMVVKR
jgi:hypothetical protein